MGREACGGVVLGAGCVADDEATEGCILVRDSAAADELQFTVGFHRRLIKGMSLEV